MHQIYENVEIVNEDEVRKLHKNFSSFIIALPHTGNWEFAIPMGERLNLKLLAVAEPLEDKNILNWFTSLRESLGCKIILGGKGQNTYQKLLNHINDGYHVCLLADRHVGNSGVGVEFFNQMAAFPKGPIALSLETQVPVIPAAFITVNGMYKLIFGKPFIVPHFENDAQSIQHGLKVLSKELEKLILLDPNQWHSIQPVWTSEY
jgi:KDO2-lipid IV(A) lauroyltransferase